jgi:hypothetical protein
MGKAGFLDRLGDENVCADIELSLARARAILGLPPAPPSDPLHEQKQQLEAAKQEIASALQRAQEVLNSTAKVGNSRLPPSGNADSLATRSEK